MSLCAEKSFSFSVGFAWAEKVCLFRKTKGFRSQKALRTVLKSRLLYVQKAFYAHNPFLMQSKATLFHPPSPVRTTLNLLSAKNTTVLLLFALILCCKAGASHRFKSLPAIPGEVAAFRKTGYLMMAGCFSGNYVSTGDLNRGSQGFAPRAFWLLFARCKKWQPVLPRREIRGSANLESAHIAGNFTQTKLNPSAALGGFYHTFCKVQKVWQKDPSLSGKLRGSANLDSARRSSGFMNGKMHKK